MTNITTLTLEEGLKFLFNKNLAKSERHLLQAISACRQITEKMPQTMIGPTYVPALQEVLKNHGKGTWKASPEGIVTLELEGDNDATE
jgi:hypothetical protein